MANNTSTYVAKKAAALTGLVGAAASLFVQSDNALWAAFCGVPGIEVAGTSALDGRAFYLRASGKITTGSGGTSTFLPGIYYVASNARTTVTAPTVLVAGVASTALAATTSYPWLVEATCIWDSTSQVLTGYYDQIVGIASGLTTQAINISNFISSVALDSTTAGQGFQCAITMGTTRTGCTVSLSEFILEVL